MRHICTMLAMIAVVAGGLILLPAPRQASGRQFKQLGIAIINYQNSVEPPDRDRLIAEEGDESLGLLVTEKDEVLEVVGAQVRDNDFVMIQLGTGETVPAVVVWSDVDDFMLMDADGGLALFIVW